MHGMFLERWLARLGHSLSLGSDVSAVPVSGSRDASLTPEGRAHPPHQQVAWSLALDAPHVGLT